VIGLNDTEFTTISEPENATVGVATIPVPVMVIGWLVAPAPREFGVALAGAGAVFTLKHDEHVAGVAPSGLVTVMLRGVNVDALEDTLMLAVISVELPKVTEFTLIPVPENSTLPTGMGARNPVPVMMMFWLTAPCPRELGVAEVAVGFALTVKHPVQVPDTESVLVTVTFRVPGVADPETDTFAVTSVLLTKVTEFTVTPEPNEVLKPRAKLVPARVMFSFSAPCPREAGDTPVTVGASDVTVKQFVQVALPASELVTRTFQVPGPTESRLNDAVIRADDTTATDVPAIVVCPAFVSSAVIPGRKSDPLMVRVVDPLFEAPVGEIDVIVGADARAVVATTIERTP